VTRQIRTLLIGILAAGQVAQAQAADKPPELTPRVLEPTAVWRMDYGPERCRLIRSFADPAGSLTLQIESYGMPGVFRALVGGSAVPGSVMPSGSVRYGLSPDRGKRDWERALLGKAGDLPAASFPLLFIPDAQTLKEVPGFDWYVRSPSKEPADLARFKAQLDLARKDFISRTDAITLDFPGTAPLTLKVGNMTSALGAMDHCLDELIKSWGVDPAVYRAQSRGAIPVASTVRKVRRIVPVKMWFNGLSALVPVRVMVDENGEPTKCTVQIDDVDEAFKKAACEGFTQRFEPALDANGKPTASFYRTDIIYLSD
jgi:hypothetical protein